jgi:hypothetical protein
MSHDQLPGLEGPAAVVRYGDNDDKGIEKVSFSASSVPSILCRQLTAFG